MPLAPVYEINVIFPMILMISLFILIQLITRINQKFKIIILRLNFKINLPINNNNNNKNRIKEVFIINQITNNHYKIDINNNNNNNSNNYIKKISKINSYNNNQTNNNYYRNPI